jgi:hypothetical protein
VEIRRIVIWGQPGQKANHISTNKLVMGDYISVIPVMQQT